jgi:hypothetical protein
MSEQTFVVQISNQPVVLRVAQVQPPVVRVAQAKVIEAKITGGISGPQGPQGPPGAATSDVHIHIQAIPSDTWVIEHNLGYYPSVTVVDTQGDFVLCSPHYDSMDVVTVTFGAAFGGQAYLS